MGSEYFGEKFDGSLSQRVSGERFRECVFREIEFVNESFVDSEFVDCVFESCVFSLVKNQGMILSRAEFKNCQFKGMNFSRGSPVDLSVNFPKCFFKQCSFEGMKLSETRFSEGEFVDVVFEDCQLVGANFRKSSFKDCVFQNNDLRESTFLHASGFEINPVVNKLFKARFSKDGLFGLVKDFGIKLGGK